MKLTGELKDNVEKTATREEAKEVIADAGMELTDEELDNVAGGEGFVNTNPKRSSLEQLRNLGS